MKVSISKAADMVGVTRATFYRHVDDKGISVERDADGSNPRVDVSELIRVYGDRVRPEGHGRKEDSDETGDTIQPIQDNTGGRGLEIAVELEVLRERIDNFQKEREQSKEERDRERQLLTEQIEMLRARLIESEQQQKRLTLLLTSDKETVGKQEHEKKQKMDMLEETIQRLEKQNKRIIHELQEQKKQQEQKRPWWRIRKSG